MKYVSSHSHSFFHNSLISLGALLVSATLLAAPNSQGDTLLTNLPPQSASASENLKNGEAFLAKLAEQAKDTEHADAKHPKQTTHTASSIRALPNGIFHKILKEGNGKKPSITDTVTVNYEGKLINGTVFDSSYTRGQPASFPLNQVIPGWTEALKHMPVGSTWEIVIPSKMAYGTRGAGAQIPSNSTLIFKVELIKIDS